MFTGYSRENAATRKSPRGSKKTTNPFDRDTIPIPDRKAWLRIKARCTIIWETKRCKIFRDEMGRLWRAMPRYNAAWRIYE
jgi:hypothetical protein